MSVAVNTYNGNMSRWNPNARDRLEQAAFELYRERGFEQTTVVDITSRAGLTERTFFRYFADKREVLFGGVGLLHELLANKVAEAPASLSPLDAVASALEAVNFFVPENRDYARARWHIIAANVELQERELIKFARLSAALAEVLRSRGVSDHIAVLTADAGMAIFKVAFTRWIDEANPLDFGQLVRQTLEQLRAITSIL